MRAALMIVGLLVVTGCGAKAPPVTPPQSEFERTMLAAERALRDLDFDIDRVQHRDGSIVTEPKVTALPVGPDVRTPDAAARALLATYRRTARVTVDEAGVADVRVDVERQTVAERRVTDPVFARKAFRRGDERGTPETDAGRDVSYYGHYDVGRDAALEREITRMIDRRRARL